MYDHFFSVQYTRAFEYNARKKFIKTKRQDYNDLDTKVNQELVKEIHTTFIDVKNIVIKEYVVDDENDKSRINQAIASLESSKLPDVEEYCNIVKDFEVYNQKHSTEETNVSSNEETMVKVPEPSLFNNETKVQPMAQTYHRDQFLPRKYLYVYWCTLSGIKTRLCHFEPQMSPLISKVLTELVFCNQVYEMPTSSKCFNSHLLTEFVRGVIQYLNFEDFKQGDKIDQIVDGAIEIMNIPSVQKPKRHKVRPNTITRNENENEEQFKRRIVEKFIEKSLTPLQDHKVPSHEMQAAFFQWLGNNVNDADLALFNKNNFTPILRSFGCNTKRTQNGIVWMDLSLNT